MHEFSRRADAKQSRYYSSRCRADAAADAGAADATGLSCAPPFPGLHTNPLCGDPPWRWSPTGMAGGPSRCCLLLTMFRDTCPPVRIRPHRQAPADRDRRQRRHRRGKGAAFCPCVSHCGSRLSGAAFVRPAQGGGGGAVAVDGTAVAAPLSEADQAKVTAPPAACFRCRCASALRAPAAFAARFLLPDAFPCHFHCPSPLPFSLPFSLIFSQPCTRPSAKENLACTCRCILTTRPR